MLTRGEVVTVASTTLAYRERMAGYFRNFMGNELADTFQLRLMGEDAPVSPSVGIDDIAQPIYAGYQPITITVGDMPSPALESEGYNVVIGGPGKTFSEPPTVVPIYGWTLVDLVNDVVLLYEKFPQPINTGPGQPLTVSITYRVGNCP